MTHGRPSPKKTFTQLEPVTLPTAESAYSEVLAAVILAKVSGREVPMATRVMAVTAPLRLMTQPKMVATSATMAVMIPMKQRAIMKAGTPPPKCGGGTKAKTHFQPMHMK